jgi:hypothetical protein
MNTRNDQFTNLVKEPAFKYYDNPNAINGIMIDINSNTLHTVRSVFSLFDWVSNVGGIMQAIQFIAICIFPFVAPLHDLESYLVSRLYKRPASQADDRTLQTQAENAVAGRQPIAKQHQFLIGSFLRRFRLCFCRYSDKDIV